MNTSYFYQKNIKGMTLVELLIAIAVLMLVFGGLMGSFKFVNALVGSSKAHAGAVALANGKMEYIRSLPYDDVGTQGGIPNGPLPQLSTTTLNGVEYSERILVEFVDAPQDGTDASDINGIVADYKLAKVQYSWDFRGETKTISLITNIVPRGIETTAGGGTLIVNVFDADVLPVSGASVRLYNNTGTTTIDTTRYTNVNGVAMFSGAPALAGYEITVTDTGYSTDQTYVPSVANPNPITLPVAVLEAEVSTMNFQIDELSNLAVRTVGLPTVDNFEDQFDDATLIGSQSDTVVVGGEVQLTNTAGVYTSNGAVYSTSTAPSGFESWNFVSFDARIPTDTSVVMRVYDTTGGLPPVLISDTDLPGNSAGFAPGALDISSLDVSTYQSLALGAVLATSDTATSSALLEWGISYTVSQPAIPNIPFSLVSGKTIGTDGGGAPIYKFENSFSTDGSGEVEITDLEFDVYEVVVDDASYAISEACENVPYALDAGVDETLILTLVPATTHSFRIRVEDTDGNAIPEADVTLARSGYSDSSVTSACGQVFFSSLSSAIDYSVDVQAVGYNSQTVTDVEVSGEDTMVVTLVDA